MSDRNNYYRKYLKYKQKYLELKGGEETFTQYENCEAIDSYLSDAILPYGKIVKDVFVINKEHHNA